MKLHKIVIVAIALFVGSVGFLSAQEIEKSTKTELIGQKYYYIHTVKQGQTIYGIAKAYSVDIKEIYAANPQIKNDIQSGIILKVPQVKNPESVSTLNHTVEKGETLYKIANEYNLKVVDITAINPGLTESIKPGQQIIIPLPRKKLQEALGGDIHSVQKGETLFSIATQYSTTVEELKKINAGLTENLKLGQQIRVPKAKVAEKSVKKDSVITFECGKTGKQDSYNIAVMIPFYLEQAYTVDTGDLKTPASSYRSLTFIQFYEGIRLALDTLESMGISAKVYVYDVGEDTGKMETTLNRPEFSTMNLVIGPLFSSNFTIAARWAEKHKVNIINPFTNKSDLLNGNPYAFKLEPSLHNESMQIISFIQTNYPASNILIVYNEKEAPFADSLNTLFHTSETANSTGLQIHKIDYTAEGFAGVDKNLSEPKINIVITLIDGEAFVSTFLRSLTEKAYSDKILLFGRKNWENYNNLEIEYLLNLNTHIYSGSFIDYKDSRTQSMALNFRNKYKTEPDFYAFQGYDIMFYFLGALHQYGKNFQNCLQSYNPVLLCNNFHFTKSKNWGYENSRGIIYRYENYKAINASLSPLKEITILVKTKP
jgi:LysM repeat protein